MKKHLLFSIILIINFLACKEIDIHKNVPSYTLVNQSIAPWQTIPERLVFENLTVDNGLSSNAITRLFMDKKGYLWIGTDNGLNRYDGHTFKVFKHDKKNPNTISDNNIIDVQEDSKGNIWVFSPKGLNEIQSNGKITAFLSDTSFTNKISTNRSKILIDSKDRLWIREGWNSSGHHFDIATKAVVFHENEALGSLRLYLFVEDTKHNLWGLSTYNNKNKLLKLNEQSNQFEVIKDSIFLGGDYDVVCDKNNNLWTGGGDGNLTYINTQTGESKIIKSNPLQADRLKKLGGTINNMYYAAEQDALFLGTWGGVIRMDLNSTTRDTFQRYIRSSKDFASLSDNIVHDVLVDKSGNLWAGTSSGGLCKYSPTKQKFDAFNVIAPDSTTTMASNQVETMLFDKNNNLWLGTNRGLNYLRDRKKHLFNTFWQPQSTSSGASNWNSFKSLVESSNEPYLYPCYWGSIPDRFNTITKKFEALQPRNLPKNLMLVNAASYFLNQNTRLKDGNIAYAIFGGLIYIYNPTTKQFLYYTVAQNYRKEKLLSELNSSIYESKEGFLWLSNSEGKGLSKIDFSKGNMLSNFIFNSKINGFYLDTLHTFGTITNFKPDVKDDTKLQSGMVNCFFEDSQNRFWLGTPDGLCQVLDKEKGIFKHFGEEAGFKTTAISAIQEDSHGQLWISTNDGGIVVFNPNQNKVIYNFTKEDGLVSNQFSSSCTAKNTNGLMAFGSTKGFNLFHPDSLCFNKTVPNIEISRVFANNVEKNIVNDEIVIPYDSNTIRIDVSVMDFSNPRNNKIIYKIEGLGDSYSSPTFDNSIVQKLSYGTYTLHVKGTNNDGIWSEKEATLKITISPPWWATWWFRTLLLLFFGGLGIYRLNLWNKLRKVKERERDLQIGNLQAQALQAQLNPHFIFNVLMTMQAKILNNDRHEASKMLVDLSKLIRNFLEASISSNNDEGNKFSEILLEKEVELLDMYVRFEQMKNDNRFQYNLEVAPDINTGNEEIPPLLVQPFVENAIKHGVLYRGDEEGLLTIRFYKEYSNKDDEDILVCEVEDNGVGRIKAAELQAKDGKAYVSRGTSIIKKRVEILNHYAYNIDIKTIDNEPQGTKVTIKIGYK